jgi:hypothetical protein
LREDHAQTERQSVMTTRRKVITLQLSPTASG